MEIFNLVIGVLGLIVALIALGHSVYYNLVKIKLSNCEVYKIHNDADIIYSFDISNLSNVSVIVTKVQLFNKHGEELFDNGFDVEKFDEEYTENSGSGFISSPLMGYIDHSHFYQKPFTHELEIFPASRETLSYYLDEPIHSIKVTTNKRIYKFKKHQLFFPHFDNQI